jgi:transposase
MAMGRRKHERQATMFITIAELPATAGHPFYEKLNDALRAIAFDRRVEEACQRFYHEKLGRPGIAPGVYFRMLLIGYFEGIDSERGIAWRTSDSLSLRRFLGYELSQETPDHSSLSRVRGRLDSGVHDRVFQMVLEALAKAGLVKGQTIGVDATTLEANAAMRSIVRKDGVPGAGQSYEQFLTELAKNAGIEQPTRGDLAKLDKKRPKKGSNDEWENPHDPDAKITKMKDGRTHLAHKAEHVVDMTPAPGSSGGSSGAILGVSLHGANEGDTSTGHQSVAEAFEHVAVALQDEQGELPARLFEEVVADKGYHSNDSLLGFEQQGLRPQISEPDRGRRCWNDKAEAQRAVYANRRRVRSKRGKQLQRQRGEKLERSNAHLYETGGMRRTHLRGHANILKRLIVHAAGFNLGLLMRACFGIGKPRTLQDAGQALRAALGACLGDWISQLTLRLTILTMWLLRGRHPIPRSGLRLAA